ncbi:type II toxin-antitoxin system RelE/ParE family toxin [Longimicrobium sp.]|uniref:type II toxin-antitoxin system RelE/ParE family toxin n=1 Tax=Longimicrobium sp. TaxID=2029185 RepID=UPI002BFD9170|nr:type II toxin-antitoxin system RelE/ParE family toxin [Longimicrobium sp.]HSU16359.1 type II toxin-antitoxin system RelE/ParE family toxin [Longimicrobium sp.]
MCFEVEYTDEFADWWDLLDEQEQVSIDATVQLLELMGPGLPFPHCSRINGSRHRHLRELRVQHQGRPYRVLYAFDPRRVALLLIGGDKTGNGRWYEKYVPIADRLYDEHLLELARGG